MKTEEEIRAYCKKKKYGKDYGEYWAAHPFDEALYSHGIIDPSVAPHHILSRGGHGNIDEPWNLLALSRENHARIHTIGPHQFAEEFPHLSQKIHHALAKVLDILEEID